MAKIILVRAEAGGAPLERIEASLPLDAAGRLDPTMLAGGEWRAMRLPADAPALHGVVLHDPDGDWWFQFSSDGSDPDAPRTCLLPGEAPFALGGYVSLRDPGEEARAWQVVSLE